MRWTTAFLLALMSLATVSTAPAAERFGGGPQAEPVDRASEEISALHPGIVAAARQRGLALIADGEAAQEAAAKFQYPLRSTSTDFSLQSLAISNHVDLDPTSGLKDFACGNRTYDGHGGTDIFLWPYSWHSMDRKEVNVVAALGGEIISKNDGEFDRRCAWVNNAKANYVIIRHDNGLLGYYWHFQKGSVTSKAVGSRVATGEYLGRVGSSGRSTGPHLHFEIRTASGKSIEPNAGACNAISTQWTHQGPTIDTAILDVASFSSPPLDDNQCSSPVVDYKNSFSAGQTAYAGIFLRDQKAGQSAKIEVFRPNGTLATSWVTGSPATGFWKASWWWVSVSLPANAPAGDWRIRATIGTAAAEHVFTVKSPNKATSVSASLSVSALILKPGQPKSLTVTVKNLGSATARGCQLSIARPIRADLAFRRLSTANLPLGVRNQAFSVAASTTAKVKLTLTPASTFSAGGAQFPLRLTCTNTPPAESRLVLSSN